MKQYGRLATRNIILGVGQAISSVLLGIAGVGPAGLLSSMGMGRLLSLIGVAPTLGFRKRVSLSRPRLVALAIRYRRFPLVATWSRAFNVIGLQLPPILIVAIYGSFEAGLYALTLRVLAAPVGIVADAVSQYFEGIFAERVRARSTNLRSLIVTITLRLSAIAIVPSAAVAVFGPWTFAIVFGAEWERAGAFAGIVVWFYAVQFAISPITRALLVLEKQFQQLCWDIARALLTAVAVITPLFFGGTLTAALFLLTGVQIALYVVGLFMCLRAAGAAERVYRH